MKLWICKHGQLHFGREEDGCVCEFLSDAPRLVNKATPAFKGVDELNREHWTKLHSYRFTTADLAREFYRQWQDTIPNIDCGCMAHWKELVRDFPPDFSSAEAFFTWGVEAHNKVNKRLKKTILTIEEAKALWQSSLPTQHS